MATGLGPGVHTGLFLLLAYLAFPIDLPISVRCRGHADGVIVVGVALRSVIHTLASRAFVDNLPGSADGGIVLARLPRLAGLGNDS